MTSNDLTLAFNYKINEEPSFDLLGFTKIVVSGCEQYDQIRHSGKWDILRQIATTRDPVISAARCGGNFAASWRYASKPTVRAARYS